MHESRSPRRRAAAHVVAVALTLAAVSLPFAAGPVSAATPYGVNLVRNPGAEEGPGTNGYTTVAIPGWEAVGDFTVVRYGAPEFPTKAESARIGGGKKFFSCGPDTDIGALRQSVRIVGRGSRIDAGRIKVRLKARQAGYANGPDEARVEMAFIDAADDAIGSIRTKVTIGTSGVFLARIATTVLPVGTRSLIITLQGVRGSDGGSYCDAYFDNVSVKLELVN